MSPVEELEQGVGVVVWRTRLKQIPGVQQLVSSNVFLENWWFDASRGVDTSPAIEQQRRRGWPEDRQNFQYLPTRPKCARRALRGLQLADSGRYTFVDMGSGKGRVLFIAAEYEFKSIRGVELRQELHNQACANLRSCRMRNVRSGRVECIHSNATEYEFPDDDLIVFFFNPFSREIMEQVLNNLADFVKRRSHEVFLILHQSVCEDVVDACPQFALKTIGNGYRIHHSI